MVPTSRSNWVRALIYQLKMQKKAFIPSSLGIFRNSRAYDCVLLNKNQRHTLYFIYLALSQIQKRNKKTFIVKMKTKQKKYNFELLKHQMNSKLNFGPLADSVIVFVLSI